MSTLTIYMIGIIMTGMRWRTPYAFAIGGIVTLLIMTLKPGWIFVTALLVVVPVFGYFLGASIAERARAPKTT